MSAHPDDGRSAAPTPIATGVAPPHSIEAEQAVLGAILLSERAMDPLVIEEGLHPDDFYRERHRLIYAAMRELYEEGEPIDVVTVADRLERTGKLDDAGGRAAVDDLTGGVPGLGASRRYARIVREHALMRRLLTTTYEIQASVLNHQAPPRELVERAERMMLEVAHDDRQQDFHPIKDVMTAELKKLEKLSREGTALTGTPSGFKALDEITGGFQPGNLVIIAARPSMGKSALVANIAENVAVDHGKAVALFSLEMSESELAQRFVASQARIKGDELRKGRVAEHRWPKIIEAASRLSQSPLFIDDSSDVGILEIRAKARRLHQQHEGGLGLVIIDYLQLLRPDGRIDSRVLQIGEMSRGLKILARELAVPVIALSQLSRAVETRGQSIESKRPLLSDLRECVTGDTLVTLADGRRAAIRDLVGTTPDVVSVDEHDRLVVARSDMVWPVGRRSVRRLRLASGRTLRATADHRIRSGAGWSTLGELAIGDRVALARTLPEPAAPGWWPDDRLVLLGHLIGDGSYLTDQPLRHTTASPQNSLAVQDAAEREFGATVRRHPGRGAWHQLVISGSSDRRHPAGVDRWLRQLGIWNQRSSEKRIPSEVFALGNDQLGLLLRHLWATDGTTWSHPATEERGASRISFATASEQLAADVAALLLRLGIVARIAGVRQPLGTLMYTVDVMGAAGQLAFLDRVGAWGPREAPAAALRASLDGITPATNVDTLPLQTRARVGDATVASDAVALADPGLEAATGSDLFSDRVVGIDDDGVQEVYDLTVPGPACWLADGIVSHNSGSIEQDADLVMFIFREEYYDHETEREGIADLIISKHRNGALGNVEMTFAKEYPKFYDYAGDRFKDGS